MPEIMLILELVHVNFNVAMENLNPLKHSLSFYSKFQYIVNHLQHTE